MVSLSVATISGGLLLNTTPNSSFSSHHSATPLKWGLRRDLDGRLVTCRSKGQTFHVLSNPNLSPGGNAGKEVIMVDPLEAKRLAAKQMEQIKAKENIKRKRRIEAINGAWAMIGLTVGLVIEGQTGNSILEQLAGYWTAFISFFIR